MNTSSSKVEVRWNVRTSQALSPDDVVRICDKLASRVAADGTLRVAASDSRSQRRNRDLAEARLVELVRRALVVPKPRRATKRPRGADEARLQDKRERATRKGARRWKPDD